MAILLGLCYLLLPGGYRLIGPLLEVGRKLVALRAIRALNQL
jgi:hypothetical protein